MPGFDLRRLLAGIAVGGCLWAALAPQAAAQSPLAANPVFQSMKAREEGRYADALAIATDLLAAAERHPASQTSEDFSGLLVHIGRIHADQGLYEQAQPFFERALAVDEARLGLHSTQLDSALMYLAGNEARQRRFDAAEARYRRLLAVLEARHGKAHVNLVLPLRALLHLCRQQGRAEEAEAIARRVLELWRSPSGSAEGTSVDGISGALQSLGALQADRQNLRGALRLHRQALAMIEAQFAEGARKWGTPGQGTYARLADGLERLAQLYRLLGEDAEAQAHDHRAKAVRSEMKGSPFGSPASWMQGPLPLTRQ